MVLPIQKMVPLFFSSELALTVSPTSNSYRFLVTLRSKKGVNFREHIDDETGALVCSVGFLWIWVIWGYEFWNFGSNNPISAWLVSSGILEFLE